MKVFIAGIEENGSMWHWFPTEQERDSLFNEVKEIVERDKRGIAYKGEVIFEGTPDNEEIRKLLWSKYSMNEFEWTDGFIQHIPSISP